MQRILREFNICARLKHPNILLVHGYTSGFGPFIAIVNPWAENGNLSTYLEREDTSLTVVRRFQIVNLWLLLHIGKRLIVMLAQRCHGWTSISYVLVSMYLTCIMTPPWQFMPTESFTEI